MSRLLKYSQMLLLAALICAIWGRVAVNLAVECWTEPSASQGLVIACLALWCAWANRKATLGFAAASNPRAVCVIAFASVILLAGKLSAEFFLQRLSLILLIAGLAWTFWGRNRLRTLILPLTLLAAIIPLPVVIYNDVSHPLQLIASDISARLIRLCGTDVLRDGNILRLNGISLGIEEACNGLNALSALVITSIILGLLYCRRRFCRVLLIVSAVALAIGTNIVRIALTALIADHHRQFALGVYHTFSGWLIFLLGFGALVLVTRSMFWLDRTA